MMLITDGFRDNIQPHGGDTESAAEELVQAGT